ncbi:MAG: corrinoid protein [Eubacteriales bacterium]
MNKEQIFQMARESIIECDEDKALMAINEAKSLNFDLIELLSLGFSSGIRELGDLFGRGEIFLPELIYSTEVMKKATTVIEGSIGTSEIPKRGKMVIGTVAGDVHDIGKGIVASLVKSNGIEVFDLGREVPALTFIEKAEEYGADFIGSSALLTTTMTEQKKIEEILRKEGLRDKYKTMVGGAPVTKRWAEKIGADAYCEDAAESVKVIMDWVNLKK